MKPQCTDRGNAQLSQACLDRKSKTVCYNQCSHSCPPSHLCQPLQQRLTSCRHWLKRGSGGCHRILTHRCLHTQQPSHMDLANSSRRWHEQTAHTRGQVEHGVNGSWYIGRGNKGQVTAKLGSMSILPATGQSRAVEAGMVAVAVAVAVAMAMVAVAALGMEGTTCIWDHKAIYMHFVGVHGLTGEVEGGPRYPSHQYTRWAL